MPVKARAASLRVRLVSREDAAALVPLFEAFYGTYFGEPVVEGTVARRLRQVESFETVVVAEGGGRLVGFASLRVTPPRRGVATREVPRRPREGAGCDAHGRPHGSHEHGGPDVLPQCGVRAIRGRDAQIVAGPRDAMIGSGLRKVRWRRLDRPGAEQATLYHSKRFCFFNDKVTTE